ncbi:sugar phosphate isomerase/epimerase [Sphaerochaeta pleomorpha str. Grapes]|uniref:Sugar phosphate isomerase/epimerase n=1 Tax=Sphaerochaeta pleomorpha (strain ATCC BAA-1885 / DSM 22778 / Grapes) TaxID=158190 RepID=G8QRQ6_SPHPG|nr:sugar phosphate isomerase/epimerase [Sphaerochaeta pleomorpha]AEV28839.1 sugar phosphate isomerase/epimerase [Sphaerochaeta pleomorpha str. Grapes]
MPIKIGALLKIEEITADSLSALSRSGFETLAISFWGSLGPVDLENLADLVRASSLEVSALSIFGNPLGNEETLTAWKELISHASLFGSPYVTGFAGRVPGNSVEHSLSAWKETFSSLLEIAYKKECKGLLFENCRMGDLWKRGNWNIAINDEAWSLMFNALDDGKLGLEWEPCHQVEAFLDPLAQLLRWKGKVKHVHGKDATVNRQLLSEIGIYSSRKAITPVLPGLGDTDWASIKAILTQDAYEGCIDIESMETTFFNKYEQKLDSLRYLQQCDRN